MKEEIKYGVSVNPKFKDLSKYEEEFEKIEIFGPYGDIAWLLLFDKLETLTFSFYQGLF